jgi:UDP-N-acetylglucosamine 2-epimerase (non-hydrolysing)
LTRRPRIVSVVGARPQFVKAGPVSKALADAGVDELLLHTGQHYDDLLSEKIMSDIGLRQPDVNLGVGSASHARQTARMMEGIEDVLGTNSVDAVLIYGDTNSTVAGALAATKLGILTAHVEAGLRSFNRSMPEELNRVAADHLSDLLLAPTHTAMGHLGTEGLAARSVLTGDVMVDALHSIDFAGVEPPDWAAGDFVLATIHRAENTDDPQRLGSILTAMGRFDMPVHLLAHPRLVSRMQSAGITAGGRLSLHEPLGYAAMLATLRVSRGLLTDSGGLQKEAFILRVPCVTLRTETEWPETFAGSWNVLAEPGEDLQALVLRDVSETIGNPFGDGHAAERVVSAVMRSL